MAVPNTETFNLTDITTEIGGGLISLQACFDNANSSGFDPTYNNDGYAPANSLLRFRNYNHSGGVTPIDVALENVIADEIFPGIIRVTGTIKVYEAGTSTPYLPTSTLTINYGVDNINGAGLNKIKSEDLKGDGDGSRVTYLQSSISGATPYDVTVYIIVNFAPAFNVTLVNDNQPINFNP
jgi:hypothetical protein